MTADDHESTGTAGVSESHEEAATAAKTVLIVDDDRQVREMLDHRFSADYTVETATDGPSCLEYLREATDGTRPDLILLDVMMPGQDGLQVLAEIQDIDGYESTPVIMLTGSGRDEIVTQAFELGADDFTTKPLSLDELSARVHRLIDGNA